MLFLIRSLRQRPEFKLGMQDMLPQAPGIASWGLMTGVAMVKSGLSPFEAVAMNLLVFAGSAQLASLPLIAAGAPAWVIFATAFCVNLRFVVFSLHLREYLVALPLWRRLAQGYVTADMSYAIFTRRYPHPAEGEEGRAGHEAYLAGNCAVNWTSWITASFVGIALTNVIPTSWGLGFAGTLSLMGIMCSLATTRLRVLAAAVAATAAVAAYTLPLKLNIVVAIALAVMAGLWLQRMPALREHKA